MTAKKAVYKVLDEWKAGTEFQSEWLRLRTKQLTGKQLMTDTALRHMRSYRAETGRVIVNVNNDKSIYRIGNEQTTN